MTEAWKSQPKKFCGICKCWFADNRVSIQFHEKGLRHQEAVKKKLEELSKKGSLDEKIAQYQKFSLAKMEEEAVKALNRDLRENPHMASQYNLAMGKPDAEGIAKGLAYASYIQPVRKSFDDGSTPATSTSEFTAPSIWVETVSPDGDKFYWNTTTNETQWDPPSQSFLTMAEYEDYMREKGAVPRHREPIYEAQKRRKPLKPPVSIPNESEDAESGEEQPVVQEAVEDKQTELLPPPTVVQPTGPLGKLRVDPYGQWQSVEPPKEPKPLNLGLPVLKTKDTPEVNINREEGEVKLKFKEKTVKKFPVGDKTGPIAFKKRKFGGSLKNRDDHIGDDDD